MGDDGISSPGESSGSPFFVIIFCPSPHALKKTNSEVQPRKKRVIAGGPVLGKKINSLVGEPKPS